MAEQGTMKGRLVAATEKPYSIRPNPAKGEPGREGLAYAVWLSPAFDEEPVKVKVSAVNKSLWDQADEAGPDADVSVTYSLRGLASGGVERQLLSIQIIAS